MPFRLLTLAAGNNAIIRLHLPLLRYYLTPENGIYGKV